MGFAGLSSVPYFCACLGPGDAAAVLHLVSIHGAHFSRFTGTFGRVLECWDRKYKDYVAVKVIRNVDKYRHAAMIEVRCVRLVSTA